MKSPILIVDDEPNNHIVYERILAPLGLEIIKAMSGQQALGLAHKHDFFLILMDVQMPGMDGFETASLILDHPKTSHIPVIFITAFARDECFEFQGYQSGAVDYMVKPVDDQILCNKVHVFLSLYSERLALKKALAAIQLTERRYRTLFEVSHDAIFLLGRNGTLHLDANEAAIKLTGRSLEEMQSLSGEEAIFSPDIVADLADISRASPTRDFGTVTFARKDSKPRLAHFSVVLLDDKTMVGIGRDVTDEQTMQLQLRRTQKMDAVGQLTGGIAHDFNNILGIILGNIELIQGSISEDDKIAKKVESIRKSARRAADLTSQLLSFSGRQAIEVKAVNINHIIRDMDSLIGRSVTPQITVAHHVDEELWHTSVDSGDFEDVLLNLVINAHDAISGSGQITIETCNAQLDEAFAKINPGAIPGDYVQLAVSDTGHGIPEEIQEHLFEPFFTTKKEGKGTGLGLAMVYGFVRRSQGYIKVYSEMGKGTTFRVYLPKAVTQGTEDHAATIEQASHLSSGHEYILIVDDESSLLELATETLENQGYRTITANCADEAIKCLDQHPEIELLFSDIVMPGKLNGFQLAKQATEQHPGLKVLLTSGFTSRAAIGNSHELYTTNLLNKPYAQAELVKRVQKLFSVEGSPSE